MRKYFALFLIVLMAVSVVSAAGVVSASHTKPAPAEPVPVKPATKTLSTPKLLSPAPGTVFNPGDIITLSWTPVKHATDYLVRFMLYAPDGAYHGGFYFIAPRTPIPITTSLNGYTYVWQVQALNRGTHGARAGATSEWSDSWTFVA